jgi:hypothetical protein
VHVVSGRTWPPRTERSTYLQLAGGESTVLAGDGGGRLSRRPARVGAEETGGASSGPHESLFSAYLRRRAQVARGLSQASVEVREDRP